MRVRRVLMGALVAMATVVGVGGIAGSQGESDDFVLWKTSFSSSSKYFQFNSDSAQRQRYTDNSPWTLADMPALMGVSAQNGTPYHSLLTLRHGVKSGSHGDDSISGTEVLALSIGSGLAPRRFSYIDDLKLVADHGGATARLTAKNGGEVVGSVDVALGSRAFKIIDFDVDASFDTLEFSSVSGKYGVWALANPKFHLTAAQVVAPGQPVVSQNNCDMAETSCLTETSSDGKGGEVPIVQAFGEDERNFLDVIFVGDGGTVTLQTVLTYTLDPVPAQLPVSEIDFNPLDADDTFEEVTLCASLAANGPTAGPPTPTEKPACLRTLVATDNGNGTVTVVETYELAGDPRVRFA